ncbi:phosphotransferase enzyme family protein [Fimbriimonas ginsengisoli]|uniref:Aminoglycoside phosphotransferase n=1 Tax=Fimbriimonas ginsengisoli Gsoil 348 TaxID=661478 RepID=A0A068NNU3_FIMGI|nr:phosphotransferase [Fimbriimonas ginsengisoli]AIE85238.1 aminoglycoside phosphotransferase [Fimbriimonas ginsengisoli Gsoil 348]
MTQSPEFAALTQEEQIARIEVLGRAALREFGVKPSSIASLNHAENTTYRVESPEGIFCLRVCRPGYQSDANVESEIEFMSALRKAGIEAPQPYLDRVVKASVPEVPEARNCVLLSWQPGEFRRGGYTPEDARQLGEAMARMHEFSARWTPPAGFDRQNLHGWALESPKPMAFSEPNPLITEEDRDLLQVVDREARQLLGEIPRDRDNFGLIHADLHHGNVLFDEAGLHLIDFDDTGWGFWLYDFAAALAYLATKPQYLEARAAMLAGYEQVRRLPPGTEERLEPFIRLRLAGICNWILVRTDNPNIREIGANFIGGLCEGIRATRSIGS